MRNASVDNGPPPPPLPEKNVLLVDIPPLGYSESLPFWLLFAFFLRRPKKS